MYVYIGTGEQIEKSQSPSSSVTEERKIIKENPVMDVEKQAIDKEGLEEFLPNMVAGCGYSTSHVAEASKSRTVALDGIIEALTCGEYNTIGVLGPESTENSDLLEKVSRRVKRDKLFDVVLMATVTRKPNKYRRIQDEIGKALDLKFDDDDDDEKKKEVGAKRSTMLMRIGEGLGLIKLGDDDKEVGERAKRLSERIIMDKQKILVILCDICKGLDLDKVGIPYGADHIGFKLLLTSSNEEVLSKEMHAQKVFKV